MRYFVYRIFTGIIGIVWGLNFCFESLFGFLGFGCFWFVFFISDYVWILRDTWVYRGGELGKE